MAFASDSTTAPARPLLPLRGPGGRFICRADARPELPLEPLLSPAAEDESTAPAASAAKALSLETAPGGTASSQPSEPSSPSADEVLDDMARKLDRQGVPRETSPAARMVSLLLAGASSPGHAASVAPCVTHLPDPAFAAARAFDRVVAEWDAEFAEFLGIMDVLDPGGRRCWDRPQAVARAVLGPIAGSTVAALDGLLRRMKALDARQEAAEARLLSTRAKSELGAAALRAAVRRYARRPFGCRSDEAIMLAKLAA